MRRPGLQISNHEIRLINPADFRIMAVTGNDGVGKLLEFNLEHAGYQIKMCKTYPEVVAILDTWIPDILILDEELENMHPKDFLENFYNHSLCRECFTLYLPHTSNPDCWVWNLYNAGKICCMLEPPFHPFELLTMLRRIFIFHLNSTSLAMRRSSKIQQSQTQDDSFDPGDFRILIASSEEEVRSLLQNMLKKGGYETELCKSYVKGEEILERLLPDILILDDSLEDTDAETFYLKYNKHPLSRNCLTIYVRNDNSRPPLWVYPSFASGRICLIINKKRNEFNILNSLKLCIAESRKRS